MSDLLKNYYHFKIDFYNVDNSSILETKYYFTSYDIKKELGMSEKTIYLHCKNPLFKGKKYKNLHIHRINQPVFKINKEKIDYTRQDTY